MWQNLYQSFLTKKWVAWLSVVCILILIINNSHAVHVEEFVFLNKTISSIPWNGWYILGQFLAVILLFPYNWYIQSTHIKARNSYLPLFLALPVWILFSSAINFPNFVVVLLYLLSIYSLYESYMKKQPNKFVFNTFFFLSLASIINPLFLLLIPPFYIVYKFFNVLKWDTLLTSILALLTPYWIYFSYLWWDNKLSLYLLTIKTCFSFKLTNSLDYPFLEYIMLGYLLLVGFISYYYLHIKSYQCRIQTRLLYRSLFILSLYSVFLLLLFPTSFYFLGILYVVTTLPLVNFYFVSSKKSSHVFFFFFYKFFFITYLLYKWLV